MLFLAHFLTFEKIISKSHYLLWGSDRKQSWCTSGLRNSRTWGCSQGLPIHFPLCDSSSTGDIASHIPTLPHGLSHAHLGTPSTPMAAHNTLNPHRQLYRDSLQPRGPGCSVTPGLNGTLSSLWTHGILLGSCCHGLWLLRSYREAGEAEDPERKARGKDIRN